jgi:hypothetical protein
MSDSNQKTRNQLEEQKMISMREVRWTVALCAVAALIAAVPASASAATFSNNTVVFQSSVSNAPANVYPSPIEVSGLTGPVVSVKPTLLGVNAFNPDLLDVMLVSPAGKGVVLFDETCSLAELSGESFSFDDAAGPLPGDCNNQSGTYRPTDNEAVDSPFPGAAAGFAQGSKLSAFAGGPGNGTWNLFTRGNHTGGPGAQVTGGWSLDIESAPGCAGAVSTVAGTAGNDTLVGTAGPDVFVGLTGADTIKGLGGNDLICAGGGPDTLIGGAGKDRLIGQGGKDKCLGGKGKDSAARTCETRKSV